MYGIGYDEPKFKVGDRVRVVKGGWDGEGSWHCAGNGEEDVIIADANDMGQFEGEKGFYNPDEIELVAEKPVQVPKFKVGQRVLALVNDFTPNFRSGDAGVVSEVRKDHTPPAFCVKVDGGGDFGWFFKHNEIAPAFFPGDKVRVTEHFGYFGVGDVGEVESQKGATVFVKHGHYSRVGLPIDADALELVLAKDANLGVITAGLIANGNVTASTQPCIVARVVDGTPRPSNVPYVHGSAAAATTEAERLARNNPGQEFAVYQRVAGRMAEVSYSMKEVA